MKCRCFYKNGETIVYATSYTFSQEKIAFSETDEGKKSARHFLLEKIGENKTRLTIDHYIKKGPLARFIFNSTKKRRLEDSYQRSLKNIERVASELVC
jgi:hypothetical protein